MAEIFGIEENVFYVLIAFVFVFLFPPLFGFARIMRRRGKFLATFWCDDDRKRKLWLKPTETVSFSYAGRPKGLYNYRANRTWWDKGILLWHPSMDWQEGVSEPIQRTNPAGLQPSAFKPATLYDLMEAKTVRDMFARPFEIAWVIALFSLITAIAAIILAVSLSQPPPEPEITTVGGTILGWFSG